MEQGFVVGAIVGARGPYRYVIVIGTASLAVDMHGKPSFMYHRFSTYNLALKVHPFSPLEAHT